MRFPIDVILVLHPLVRGVSGELPGNDEERSVFIDIPRQPDVRFLD
jgi:hypothetical protein